MLQHYYRLELIEYCGVGTHFILLSKNLSKFHLIGRLLYSNIVYNIRILSYTKISKVHKIGVSVLLGCFKHVFPTQF